MFWQDKKTFVGSFASATQNQFTNYFRLDANAGSEVTR